MEINVLTIRGETENDIPSIRLVHQEAFPGPDEARLVDLLRSRGKATISLLTEIEGQVVGHVLFSPAGIDGEAKGLTGCGLAPVGVLPGYQGKGIGSALIRKGLALATEERFDYVVVLGDPGYYRRFGFLSASQYGLENEYGVDEEFMVQELRPGVLAGVHGLVRYAPEFTESGV